MFKFLIQLLDYKDPEDLRTSAPIYKLIGNIVMYKE